MKILVINGANLNMLGKREPQIYGNNTLKDIESELEAFAKQIGVSLEFFQSNCEGAIIDRIQAADCPIVINAGAYSHYSYAIADALKTTPYEKIEVHISNVFAREQFRHNSVLAGALKGQICGLGIDSYKLAIRALAKKV